MDINIISKCGDSFTLKDKDGIPFTFALLFNDNGYPVLVETKFDYGFTFYYIKDKIPEKLRVCKNNPNKRWKDNSSKCENLCQSYIIYCHLTETEPICCNCYNEGNYDCL